LLPARPRWLRGRIREPLVAYKADVVAINAYLGAAAIWSGQFSRVIVNAFDWLCFTPPPPPPPPTRCRVPKVIGMTLRRSRTRIRARHCSVGRIRRTHSRRIGRVIGQSPRPGKVKPRGYPVKLVVGRR
jgi:hypothetical protein